ncbi:hypothetical protein FUAX_49290 (plasmid) [Fulvitalea axinellae]|uniref:Lipoprotein n=1 Tax=Fulvitalea axinellae TaxID=1182444 RepID=A0AAU9CZY6_9BACT|nr:hypothetical protein FUAX_49290 [Fulvitalea axinellae]
MKTAFTKIPLLLVAFAFGCDSLDLATKETDLRELKELRSELDKMVGRPCSDGQDWTIAPIGHRSGGGHDGYIAYPKSMDSVAVMKKINEYTQAQKRTNEKWSIASYCVEADKPVAVKCVDGKPCFVYK